ncbi:MAG TPA: serine hydrolase [Bacteroidia bacterium]|nr:serine hydrolase [Bacteroidia bacterium]
MKKFLKRTGIVLAVILVIANLFILFTGRTYLYKGVWNTYAKGRSGPAVDEYEIFCNREVKTGTPQPWPKSSRYNTKAIPKELEEKMLAIKSGAFLVIEHDSLVHEKYWGVFTDKSYTNSFSMAKTVVSVLLGAALQDGTIKSLDQPVGDFLPEYREGDLAKITLRHLVTMSSGVAFDEDYVNPLAYPAEAYYGSDLRALTMNYTDVTEPPGVTFRYLSGNTQVLGFVLMKATGKTLADYASEKLWIPMGAEEPAFWSLDCENGNEKTFCCLNSNARDFARIAKLYLDSGRWNGKQIVPEEYALQSVLPCGMNNADGTPCTTYSYSWWMMPDYQGHRIFYARGILGQYVIAIPDLDMIIVRLGEKRLPNDSDDIPADVYYYLDAAMAVR